MSPRKSAVTALMSLGAVALAVGVHAGLYGRELALSPDSVSYLSAARHLAAGDGLVRFDGAPFLLWPPLYPWCLALLEWLGVDALANGAWLQWFALGGTALLAGAWVGRKTGSPLRALFVTTAVLVAKPLWHVSVFLWSEPLFNLAALATLFFAVRAREHRGKLSWLLATAACAAACLTRHAGVFLVAATALVLLWPGRGRWRDRLLATGFFAAGAFVPPVLWWVRNARLTGDWSGGRVPGGMDALWGFEAYARTLADWVLPWSWPLGMKGPLALLLLVLLATAACRVFKADESRRISILACVAFVVVYSLGILGLGFVTVFNVPDHRILSPLFAPLAVLAGMAWPAHPSIPSRRFRHAALLTLTLVGLAIWIGRSAIVARRWVRIQLREETSLASPRWKDSPLAAAVAARPVDEPLFSNMPHVIYLYGHRDCLRSPRRHYFGAETQETNDMMAFAKRMHEFGVARLAWFELPSGSYLYEPDELPSAISVTLERRYADGVLYRLETAAPAGAP